jgi:mxaJ protein
MSSVFRISVTLAALMAAASPAVARDLRVCTEPNNLPFSNRGGEGFENRIAALLAQEIGASLKPVLMAQHGPGFLRTTLGTGRCQVLMGLPVGTPGVWMTRPYYRTAWMFVTRAQDGPMLSSFDDPALRSARIGVPVVGEGSDTGPVIALGRRGIVDRLVGYPVGGDLGDGDDMPERMIEDLVQHRIDVAVQWGPSAGYFAARQGVPLSLHQTPSADGGTIPLALPIAVAVKRGDPLRDELEGALQRRKSEIDAILAAYHVPVLED